MKSFRKWVSLLLLWVMLLPACGLSEGAVSWLYTFSAGDALTGKDMNKVKDFIDAVQIRLSTEERDQQSRAEAVLLSYGKPVFTLRAAIYDEQENLGLYCSLMGDCTLECRQDQVTDFLMTVIQMLTDLKILKADGLERAESLAKKAGDLITSLIQNHGHSDPSILFDLDYYLKLAESRFSSVESAELDAANEECPGASQRRTWHLTEEDLNTLADTMIQKIGQIPILNEAFREGRLQIGSQAITESFLRDLFAAMKGDATLLIYTDAEDRVIRLFLLTPDISELVTDPVFSQMRGIDFTILRQGSPEEIPFASETSVRLEGIEGNLLTVRMEKDSRDPIADLPSKKTYQVGEMNSQQLWDLLRGLWLEIGKNAINLIMDLPRVVFDTLVDHLF